MADVSDSLVAADPVQEPLWTLEGQTQQYVSPSTRLGSRADPALTRIFLRIEAVALSV